MSIGEAKSRRLERPAATVLPMLAFLTRIRPADVLLFGYVLVLAKQFFWYFSSNTAQWALAFILSMAAIWVLGLRQDERVKKLPVSFWLIVVLPLAFVFLLRVSSPDTAYDVLNYRLVYGERSLNGAQFIGGDFFPYFLAFNPAADTLTGLFRSIVGYRVGTIINLLTLIWTGTIAYRFLRAYISSAAWCSVAVLVTLSTEQMLFQINDYMVDLLVLPLILEAARRITSTGDNKKETTFDTIFVAFLLGGSLAFKLTNLAFVIPLGGLYLYWLIFSDARPLRSLLSRLSAFAAAFVLPWLPYAVYIYAYTGSPVFPAYNVIFGSPYFPAINIWDGRWGPATLSGAIAYPLMAVFNADRLVEMQYYSGRIALGAAAALICLLFARKDKRIFYLSLVTLASGFLWSCSTGYIRYALPLEIWGGLCTVYLISDLFGRLSLPRAVRFASAASICFAVGAQVSLAYGYVLTKKAWADRSTLFQHSGRAEVRYLLRDRQLRDFQPADKKELFDLVEAWIVSDEKTAGIEVLLRNDVPMINAYAPEFFDKERSPTLAIRDLLDETLTQLKGRRMYSLCYAENLASATNSLQRAGFSVRQTTPLRLRFYSDIVTFDMVFIEVLPSPRL